MKSKIFIKIIAYIIITLAILIILGTFLVGCGSGYDNYNNADSNNSFMTKTNRIKIEYGSVNGNYYYILTDTQTGKQYLNFREAMVELKN